MFRVQRMHDIVKDTDMYVGVGSNNINAALQIKEDNMDPSLSEETVYHYINPEDNSQFIMACSEALQSRDNDASKSSLDSHITIKDQNYLELSPEFITGDYGGSGNGGFGEMTVQFNAVDGGGSVKLESIGIVQDGKILDAVSDELPEDVRYLTNGKFVTTLESASEDVPMEKVQVSDSNAIGSTYVLGSDGQLVEETVVLEDGIVFEEHIDVEESETDGNQGIIEIKMEDISSSREAIEVECDGMVSNSIEEVDDEQGSMQNMEAAFEICEVTFEGD